MEQFKEVNVTILAGSDTAGVGVSRGIVPASVASSSDDGRSAMFTAGVAPEMATVAPILEDEKEKEQSPPVMEAQIATGIEIPTHCRSISANTVILDCLTLSSDKLVTTAPALESQSWVSIIEAEEQAASAVPVPSMEIDVGDGGSLAGGSQEESR